jgi:hypothetical protein
MKNLNDARWIKTKGLLFLVLGVVSSALLLALHFDWMTAALLVIAVWSFCRCYYFAFYVIEKYVDGRFRFSGIGSFLAYVWSGRAEPARTHTEEKPDGTTGGGPPS